MKDGLKHGFEVLAARHEDVAMQIEAAAQASHRHIGEALGAILLAILVMLSCL